MPDAAALLEAVRTLRAAQPGLGVKHLVARLRAEQPDLGVEARLVREALGVLEQEQESKRMLEEVLNYDLLSATLESLPTRGEHPESAPPPPARLRRPAAAASLRRPRRGVLRQQALGRRPHSPRRVAARVRGPRLGQE